MLARNLLYQPKRLLFDTFTFLPGASSLPSVRRKVNAQNTGTLKEDTGSAVDLARYGYATWMRHLVRWHAVTGRERIGNVAELGPGDSLALGLAALLSGAESYVALDFVRHFDPGINRSILTRVAELFRQQADIPNATEFPNLWPALADYRYPARLMATLGLDLSAERIQRIATSLDRLSGADSLITFQAPWNDSKVVVPQSIDLLISRAVLEHVDDLAQAYEAMALWLSRSGVISHTIDFKSHGYTRDWDWDEHWTCPDWHWTLIRGRRSWFINREPFAAHARLLRKHDFAVVGEELVKARLVNPEHLAPRFRALAHADPAVSAAWVLRTRGCGGAMPETAAWPS